jgi:hypothetical protein
VDTRKRPLAEESESPKSKRVAKENTPPPQDPPLSPKTIKIVSKNPSLPNPSAPQNKPPAQKITVSITTPVTKKTTETPKKAETPTKTKTTKRDPAPPTSPVLQQPGQLLISASKKTVTQANKTPTPVKDVTQQQIARDILSKLHDEPALTKSNENPPATPTKTPASIRPKSTPKPKDSTKKTPASRKCVVPQEITPAKDKAAHKKAHQIQQGDAQKELQQTPVPKDSFSGAVVETSTTKMSTSRPDKSLTQSQVPPLEVSGATQKEPILVDETDETSVDDLLEVPII